LAPVGMAVGGEVEDYRVEINTPGEIHGYAFWDVDADGVEDAGESLLEGTGVYLDTNRNGSQDPGEPSATSGSDGRYVFDALAPGAYTIARTDTDLLWTPTVPAGGTYAVPVTSGAVSIGGAFGSWMTGDYDFDTDVDDADIDLLGLAIRTATAGQLHDLDGDGDADFEDVSMLVDALVFVDGNPHTRGTAFGDADLDGDVDLDDFVALKLDFGFGTTWAAGDFDADGDEDLDDFVILKTNFGYPSHVVGAPALDLLAETDAADAAPAPMTRLIHRRRTRPQRTRRRCGTMTPAAPVLNVLAAVPLTARPRD